MEEEKKGLVPTGFGILLFGKEPRSAIPQAGLLAVIHYPGGEQERKEFDEPAVMIPDLLEKWLKDKLPNVLTGTGCSGKNSPALPFEMVREAVVNALIHRDYDIKAGQMSVNGHDRYHYNKESGRALAANHSGAAQSIYRPYAEPKS